MEVELRPPRHARARLGLAHREDDAREQEDRHKDEDRIVERPERHAVHQLRTGIEDGRDDKAARDRPRVHHARHEAERLSALPVLRQHQRKRLTHGHDGMFAKAPKRDEADRESPGRGNEHQQHGRDGDERTDAQHAPVGETAQERQHGDQEDARCLAHELEEAALDAADVVEVDRKVVEDGIEATHADAPDENAGEKRHCSAVGVTDLQTSLFHFGER